MRRHGSRAVPGLVTTVLTAILALGLAATAFAADQSYVHQGTFSSEGPEDGQMIHPRRSAVENSTGNLLVADRDNGRIVVFAPQAGGAGFLTSFSEGLSRPFGVAVDQSTGDVYVSDGTAGKILR